MNLFTKQKQTFRYEGEKGVRYKSKAWDEHAHITLYKIDNQQGPTV